MQGSTANSFVDVGSAMVAVIMCDVALAKRWRCRKAEENDSRADRVAAAAFSFVFSLP
jgi:hypothetical protein